MAPLKVVDKNWYEKWIDNESYRVQKSQGGVMYGRQ